MELRFVPPDLRRLDETGAELLACTIWSDERPLRGLAGLLDWRLSARLSSLAKSGFLTGALGEVLMIPGKPKLPFEKMLVFGAGAKAAFDDAAFRAIVVHMSRAFERLHVRKAVVELPGRAADAIAPERATELVLDAVGESTSHDAWWLVDDPSVVPRIQQRAQDERRRTRRTA
jgi:hypothetical protein